MKCFWVIQEVITSAIHSVFWVFTMLCFLFYIPLYFSPGHFPQAQMTTEDL